MDETVVATQTLEANLGHGQEADDEPEQVLVAHDQDQTEPDQEQCDDDNDDHNDNEYDTNDDFDQSRQESDYQHIPSDQLQADDLDDIIIAEAVQVGPAAPARAH